MTRPWFDPETRMLMLDEYVEEMPSYKKITEDQRVTDDELDEQIQRVIALLQQLDAELPAAIKALMTQALCELSVLYALQRKHSEQID